MVFIFRPYKYKLINVMKSVSFNKMNCKIYCDKQKTHIGDLV